METRKLGRTGLEVSALGFGGSPIGQLAVAQGPVTEVVNLLLDAGVNLIDTAASYHGSEAALGAAVGHRRDAFVLVSKCGQAFDDLEGAAWSAQAITQTVDRSLARLGTDHLDVMLLHSCAREVLERGEAVAALLAAREAGKIRFAGYSGDNEAAVYAAGLDGIDVIETSLSICDLANLDGVVALARERGLGVIVKRPIANAAWKDLAEQEGTYQNYARVYSERFQKMALAPADLGFAGEAAQAWAEIALRFTLSLPGVSTAIVGTTKTESAVRNLEAAAKGPLPDTAVQQIRQAFLAAEAAAGESWEGRQ
ncbi:MAG: aldo/keto reductase [Rhodospirillales bacterium]|jgi:aryl-alcohol dehydrogenase-like predicted oxidoreductase|nr:aldo/keto reductase [Rhodospirillales bacterium]MDP6804807.1 aldo/keto reductase [Rhodospirillales bacterium]